MTNTLTYPTLMEQVKSDLQQLREELLQCTTQLKQFGSTIQQVEDFLIGSKFSKGSGLIDSHKDHNARISATESAVRDIKQEISQFKTFSKWTIGAAGAVGAAIWALFIFLWNLFLKH